MKIQNNMSIGHIIQLCFTDFEQMYVLFLLGVAKSFSLVELLYVQPAARLSTYSQHAQNHIHSYTYHTTSNMTMGLICHPSNQLSAPLIPPVAVPS